MTGSVSNITSSLDLPLGDAENAAKEGIRVSGSVLSYVSNSGAGSQGFIVVESSDGNRHSSQDSSFVPGATSVSAMTNVSADQQRVSTSAQVFATDKKEGETSDAEDPDLSHSTILVIPRSEVSELAVLFLHLGTPEGSLLASTAEQDIFWGGAGADIFQLSSTGVADRSQADIILDYSLTAGDYLALSDTLTPEALVFEVIDFSGDGTADSTVVRSSIDNTILAVVLNTVNELGETLLSTADFLEPAAVEDWVASNLLPERDAGAEPGTSGSIHTSSSSSSYIDSSGAGSSTSATATSATGETSTSSETVYTPGASSSGGSATATANADGVNTTASAQAPLLDVLIGTAENGVLVGTDNRTIFIGHDGADTFVLFATERTSLEEADIIVDFRPEQGDRIQLPSGIAFSDIALQAVDINSNGTLDGTSIGAIETGAIYAIALGTVDIFGTSTLAAESFVTADFT